VVSPRSSQVSVMPPGHSRIGLGQVSPLSQSGSRQSYFSILVAVTSHYRSRPSFVTVSVLVSVLNRPCLGQISFTSFSTSTALAFFSGIGNKNIYVWVFLTKGPIAFIRRQAEKCKVIWGRRGNRRGRIPRRENKVFG